jgi:large subunit ribosomal protein L2
LYIETSQVKDVIARSAGTFAQLMARDGKYATIKMPSGETRLILLTCAATIGAVSNSDHQLVVSGKAGRTRWLGEDLEQDLLQ